MGPPGEIDRSGREDAVPLSDSLLVHAVRQDLPSLSYECSWGPQRECDGSSLRSFFCGLGYAPLLRWPPDFGPIKKSEICFPAVS